MSLKDFYYKHYKPIMLIPFALFVIFFIILGTKFAQTGDIINKDVSLSGGISATVYTNKEINAIDLESKLSEELNEQVFITPLKDYTTN